MISISTPKAGQSALQKLSMQMERYKEANNRAVKKCVFEIYNHVQKVTTRVNDGESRKTKKSRPTRRTKWPGLRRPTGNLARAVKTGVVINGVLRLISSATGAIPKKLFFTEGQVGVGNQVRYAVDHEREGRKQNGLLAKGKNYFPYLLPALEAVSKKFKGIFDKELKKVNSTRP